MVNEEISVSLLLRHKDLCESGACFLVRSLQASYMKETN